MLQDLTGQAKSAKGHSFFLEQGPSGILRFLSVLVKQYKVSPDKNFAGQVQLLKERSLPIRHAIGSDNLSWRLKLRALSEAGGSFMTRTSSIKIKTRLSSSRSD